MKIIIRFPNPERAESNQNTSEKDFKAKYIELAMQVMNECSSYL